MALTATVDNAFDSVNKGAAAAQGDIDAFNAARLTARKDAAYNALAQTYGPIAGDPDTAIKLNALSQSQQLFPSRLTEAQLANEKTRQGIDYDNQMNPLRVTAAKQGIDRTNALAPYAAPQAAANLESTQLSNESQKQTNEAGADTSEEDRNAATGVIAAVKDAIAKGEDPVQAFDRLAPSIAAMEGVDPTHLDKIREMLGQDAPGTISKFEAYLNAAHPNAALTRANAAMLAAQNKAAGAGGIMANDPLIAATNVDTIASRTGFTLSALDKMDALLKSGKIPSNGAMRSILGWASGKGANFNDAMYNYNSLIEQIKSEATLQDMAATKAAGVSLPRSNAALAKSEAAMTTLSAGLPTDSAREQIAVLRDYFSKLQLDLKERSAALHAQSSAKPGATTTGKSGAGAQPLSDDALFKKYGIGQ